MAVAVSSAAPPATTIAAPADHAFALYCHLDVAERHPGSDALSCLTGWIVADRGREVEALGLRLPSGRVLRCNYPFYRGDLVDAIGLAGTTALAGFTLLLPAPEPLAADALAFVALVAAPGGEPEPWEFTVPLPGAGGTERHLAEAIRLEAVPEFEAGDPAAVGALLEGRLFDQLARQRELILRLDLINKCNLRCVMCHYSDEGFAKRPVSRILPEQFAAWFAPLAPVTRDVVLSCGDEPLMSPHFETILRELAERDPDVRIRFCTNAMLLTEKIARAIVAARVHLVMFSFDGVTSATLHRIRVGSDYRRILRNILGLKRARAGAAEPRFVFNYVMLDSNIHEAPLFVALAKRLGAATIDFRHAVPFDLYDIEDEMLENNKPKYNHYREQIAAAAAAAGIEVYIPPPFVTAGRHDPAGDPACSLEEFQAELRALGEEFADDPLPAAAIAAAADESIGKSAHFFCDRPFTEVMIRDQKDVYPCSWHKEKMGVLDGTTDLEAIFFGENFRRVRLAMLDPLGAPGCAGCPIKAGRLPTQKLPAS